MRLALVDTWGLASREGDLAGPPLIAPSPDKDPTPCHVPRVGRRAPALVKSPGLVTCRLEAPPLH